MFSSVLGVTFESFDDEQDEFITSTNEFVSEMDRRNIETKLQDALQSFPRGTMTHEAYTKFNSVMTAQHREITSSSPMRELSATVEHDDKSESSSDAEAMSTCLAVQAFALVVQGQ